MKKFLLLFCLFSTFIGFTQTNIDFEAGSFTGWQLTTGTNVNSLQPYTTTLTASTGSLNIPATNCSVTTVFSIMTATNDPICSVSLNSPLGGNYVARMNRNCAGTLGTKISYPILVDNSNSMLHVAFLILLDSPSAHWITDQSFFTYHLLDQSGDTIPNASYSSIMYPFTSPDYLSAPLNGFMYKPWSSDTIDLSAYIGQTVTLEFKASNCPQGGHSGYAYVDAKTSALVTGIRASNLDGMKIYPNPVSNKINMNGLNKKKIDYEITDMFGQIVISRNNITLQEIDVSMLNKGNYLLKITYDDNVIIRKFIKE